MTKLVIISSAKMAKILEKLGFKMIRQKGSHAFFRHTDGRATVIPTHKGEDLGKGIIKSILNDVEISLEEYDKLRQEV